MKCYEVVNEDKIGGMTQISANLAVRLPQHTLQKEDRHTSMEPWAS